MRHRVWWALGAVAHERKHPADRAGSANRPVAPSRLQKHPHSLAQFPEPHAVVADQDRKGSSIVDRTGNRGGGAAAIADDTGQLLSSARVAALYTIAATSVAKKKNSSMSNSSFESTEPIITAAAAIEVHRNIVHLARGSSRSEGSQRVATLEPNSSTRHGDLRVKEL